MDSKSAKELARKLLSPKRYKHSEYVARAAAAMAARFDCDEEKALTAAYLHDIAKEMPQADLLQLLSGTDIINDKDVMAAPPVLHSFAGAEYIKKLGVADEDVLNAVRYHTTGRPDMSRLEIIIYLADYTSDDRKFAGVEQLRKLCTQSLDEALKAALFNQISHLEASGRHVVSLTKETYVQLMLRSEEEKREGSL